MEQPSPALINWYIQKKERNINTDCGKKFLKDLTDDPKTAAQTIFDDMTNDFHICHKELKRGILFLFTKEFSESIVTKLIEHFVPEKKVA